MLDQSATSEAVALCKRVYELQEAFEQATKSMTTLVAGQGRLCSECWGRKATSIGATKARGGKLVHGNTGEAGKRTNPKTDLCQICKRLGDWANTYD